MKYSLLLSGIFLLCISTGYSQNPVVNNNIWISGGFGFFSTKNVDYDTYGALSLYFSANLIKSKTTDTINKPYKWDNKWEIRFINHIENIPDDITLSHYDLGILYGKSCTFDEVLRLNISVGIGVLKTEKLEYYNPGPNPTHGYIPELKKYSTANIPLELELSVIPAKNFGIGVAGFANLNSDRNISGLLLKIDIGKIR